MFLCVSIESSNMEDPHSTTPAPPAASTTTRRSWQRLVSVELMLFFGVWLVFGMLINQKNIGMYGQSVTEAFVDYQKFTVENLPAWPWQMNGDVFVFEGNTYSNKNPGQGIISSIAYAPLKFLGFSYSRDKYLAGALVIFFSTSLFTALGAVALYRLARDLDGRRTVIWPLAAALGWAVCSTQMAWAGVAWHDPLAAPMILIAFYLLQRVRNGGLAYSAARNYSFLAAFLLGMTVTTSMTFLFMTVVIGIYFLTMRRWKLLTPFLIGGIVGVAPLFLYNTYNFGNPFSFPAMLYFRLTNTPPDVYFFLDWTNFTNQAGWYLQLINWYTPIIWLGLIGLLFLPARFRREQLAAFGVIAVLIFYMFNVSGLGVCGYGPRYLLPIMPFCALGIVGLGRFPTIYVKVLVGLVVFWFAFQSFKVNIVGAIGGALYCPVTSFAYPSYLENIARGPMPDFPLFSILLPFFTLWCLWAMYSQALAFSRAYRGAEPTISEIPPAG
jgi:hypothetical protein